MHSNPFTILHRHFAAHSYLRAVGYMLLSCFGFSLMSVGVRLLDHEAMNPVLIVMLRNAVTLALLFPIAARHRFKLLHTQRLRGHLMRGSIGAVGMITWTYCLTIMPLAHATALSFTSPLFATLFAVLFLKEKANPKRWAALLIGFAGALIIIRPDPQQFDWNSLLVMFATTSWAITGMLVKTLTRTEPPMRIVVYMNIVMLLWAAPIGLTHWQMPSAAGWATLLMIACCSILMHFSMAKAYSLAPVVSLMPFDFTRLIYTAILAWLLFNEGSHLNTWLGAAIIIGSAVLSNHAHRSDAKAALTGTE